MPPRSRKEHVPQPASISLAEGKKRLLQLITRGEAILASRPNAEAVYDTWTTACFETLKMTFGEDSSHIYTFRGESRIVYSDGFSSGYDRYQEAKDIEQLERRLGVLKVLTDEIDFQLSLQAPSNATPPVFVFWDDLHPTVVKVARPRYEAGHFADAVESVFKELNNYIKELPIGRQI
jgi:hypothetical protein